MPGPGTGMTQDPSAALVAEPTIPEASEMVRTTPGRGSPCGPPSWRVPPIDSAAGEAAPRSRNQESPYAIIGGIRGLHVLLGGHDAGSVEGARPPSADVAGAGLGWGSGVGAHEVQEEVREPGVVAEHGSGVAPRGVGHH